MKPMQTLLLSGVFVILSMPVLAYEIETHAELSKTAVGASRVARDPSLLKDLGLSPTQRFLNSVGDQRLISELFQDGARFEDGISPCDSRPGNHFYNPLNGSGLESDPVRFSLST